MVLEVDKQHGSCAIGTSLARNITRNQSRKTRTRVYSAAMRQRMDIHSAALEPHGHGVVLHGLLSSLAREFEGTRTFAMHTREGQTLRIGTVEFQPEGDRYRFDAESRSRALHRPFPSISEFKRLESPGLKSSATCPTPIPTGARSARTTWRGWSIPLLSFKAPGGISAHACGTASTTA